MASISLLFVIAATLLSCARLEPMDGLRIDLRKRHRDLESSIRSSHSRINFLSSILPESSAGNSAGDDMARLPMRQSGDGYFATLRLGTPSQAVPVMVDTALDFVWTSCSSVFQESQSSTFEDISCRDQRCRLVPDHGCRQTCAYGSTSTGHSGSGGHVAAETVTLATSSGRPAARFHEIVFGCDSGGGRGDISGAAGMGRGSVSLISQLSSHRRSDDYRIENLFSYCLSSHSSSSPLFLGRAARLPNNDEVQTTPMLSSPTHPSHYYVRLTAVRVGSVVIPVPRNEFGLNGGGILLDSATLITYFPPVLTTRVLDAFRRHVSLPRASGTVHGLRLCYDTSGHDGDDDDSGGDGDGDDDMFPSMELRFDDAKMSLRQRNYIVRAGDDVSCVAIASGDSARSRANAIGSLMQRDFHILFDNTDSTISFMPATCSNL